MRLFSVFFAFLLLFVAVMPLTNAATTTAGNFRVEIEQTHNGVIDKEFTITVQNLLGTNQSIKLTAIFDQLSFDALKLYDVSLTEYKEVMVEVKTPVFSTQLVLQENMSYEEVQTVEYVLENKLVASWKSCKSLLVEKSSNAYSENYDLITMPKFGSKATYDNFGNVITENGKKTFRLSFSVPLVRSGLGAYSSGLVRIAVNDVNYGSSYVGEPGSSWWSDNWLNGAAITLTQHPDNYNIRIALDKSDNLENLCLDNFDDIRFTENIDSEELYFFRENYRLGDNSVWWIRRVDNDIPSRDNTIYVWFNNPDATKADDGEHTFIFFDDFLGDTLDLNKWTVRAGTPTVANGYVDLDAAAFESIYTDTTYGVNRSLVTRTKIYNAFVYTGQGFTGNSDMGDAAGAYWFAGGAQFRTRVVGNTTTLGLTPAQNDWAIYEVARNSTVLAKCFYGGSQVASHDNNIPSTDLPAHFQTYSTSKQQVDWAFIRYYTGVDVSATMQEIMDFTPTVGTPVLVTPDNNSVFDYGENVTFSWTAAAYAENYHFEVSINENFDSTVENETLTDNVYVLALIFAPGDYYWRVRAENLNLENGQAMSIDWKFTIVAVSGLGRVIVSSGTFTITETVYVYAQTIDADGFPANDNIVSIKIYGSAGNQVVSDTMDYIASSDGLYRYSTTLGTAGTYLCSVAYSDGYGSASIQMTSSASDPPYETIFSHAFIIFLAAVGLFLLKNGQPLLQVFVGLAIGVVAFVTTTMPFFPYTNIIIGLIGIGDILSSMQEIRKSRR